MTEYEKLAKYLRSLKITQGPEAGNPFRIIPWERKFLKGFLGNQVSALSVARSNGKSTLLSGVAAASIDGPLMKPRAECLLVSGSFSQSRIIFDSVLAMLPDKSKFRVWDSTMSAEVKNMETGASLKCSGATPRLLFGRQNSLILCDEPASWLHTQSEKMVAALLTSLGKLENARICFLGTRPGDPDHFFQRLLDGGADFSLCFSTSESLLKNKPFTQKAIRQANPSWNYMPTLRKSTLKSVKRAKKDATFLQSYLSLQLNGGVPDSVESMLLEATTWEGAEGDMPAEGPMVWGIDLGSSFSQSGLACFWPESGRLVGMAAFPKRPSLATRGIKDGVGGLFQRCFDKGELITCGEHSVDVCELLRVALARFGKPSRLVGDRWRQADLLDACLKEELEVPIEWRGQGFKDGAEDVRTFRKAMVDGVVIPVKSLLMRSAMSVARTVSDPSGNSKIQKKGTSRDDPAVATVLAVSSAVRIPPVQENADYKIITHSL